MAIVTVTKLIDGQNANEDNFNAPLIDIDNNFDEVVTTMASMSDEIGSAITALDGRVTDLEELVGEGGDAFAPKGYDSIYTKWIDDDTIEIGIGDSVSEDGTVIYLLETAIQITLSDDLDTGSPAADTLYYAWIGLSDNDVIGVFSLSPTTPTGITSPKRIRGVYRTDSDTDIIEFVMTKQTYRYVCEATQTGTDEVSVTQNITTSWADIDFSDFVPDGQVLIKFRLPVTSAYFYKRPNGSSLTNGEKTLNAYETVHEMTAIDGIFEIKGSSYFASAVFNLLSFEI